MFHKKIFSLAALTLLLGVASMPTSVSAQTNFAQCSNVTITEISTGPQSEILLRLSSTGCGRGGFVCLSSSSLTDAQTKQAYAAALTAKATATTLQIVRWNTDVNGCEGRATGGFPILFDLRF